MGHMELSFLNTKYKKHCKKVFFECRKLNFSKLKGPKHCRNHGEKDSRVLRKINVNAKQKNTKQFNVSGIKHMQH